MKGISALLLLLGCNSLVFGPEKSDDSSPHDSEAQDTQQDSSPGRDSDELGETGAETGDDPHQGVDVGTIEGKLLMGYQGWFTCEGDGAGVGWTHWSPGNTPTAGAVSFDAWPDLSEFASDELYTTSLRYADGSVASLYSSYDESAVDHHFDWMETYGIDGVMLQRFASELSDPRFLALRDQVARNVRAGAEAHGRTFAVMYDISGMDEATLVASLEDDWRHLVDDLGLLDSPAYLHQDGLPVVAVWGLGFTDRAGSADDAAAVQAIFRGGDGYAAWTLGGVPTGWRTRSGDAKTDAAWDTVYRGWDAISPWTVGRFTDQDGADAFRASFLEPDLAAARAAGVQYMPVVFPGFSWTNLMGGDSSLNQIPRDGGHFYWRQVYNALDAGVTMLYNAMFDEVDEGTAMMKIAASQADLPSSGTFLALDADGYDLPSDFYLQLAGEATRTLRGELPLSATIPIDPGAVGNPWNAWVVSHAYQGILGRATDAEGAAAYQASLDSGMTVDSLTAALWSSDEFATTRASLDATTLATDLYRGILEREPDDAGLAGTVEAIEAGGGAERAADMLESDEARGLWSGG